MCAWSHTRQGARVAVWIVSALCVQAAVVFQPRGADFWDGAANVAVPPGDLTGYFNDVSKIGNGKAVWTLSEGAYTMPAHMARINFTATLSLVGQGRNITFVNWRGFQQGLAMLPGASISFTNLTSSGMTLGRVLSYSAESGLPQDDPSLYFISAEFWSALDDMLEPNYNTLAQKNGLESQSLAYTQGSDADVVYTPYGIQFPLEAGQFQIHQNLNALGLGSTNLFFFDVWMRAYTPDHDMERLFDMLTAGRGRTTDCYNASDYDNGYTYRGTKGTTGDGLDCLRWDDPSLLTNSYRPNPTGFSSVESNYCRNPRLWKFGPWCYTNTTRRFGLCGVPPCAGTLPTALSDPVTSSNKTPVGAIVGGVVGGAAFICIAILVAAAVLWHHRKAQHLAAAPLLDTAKPRPWHPLERFEMTHTLPPRHVLDALAVKEQPPSGVLATYSPLDTVLPWSAELRALVQTMLEPSISVDSLDARDLEFKYGRAWAAENPIDTSSLVGVGGHGKVYRGLHGGATVAFKVVNQMKTIDAMLRFIRKSALPEINLQLQPSFPSDSPHLMRVVDCVMFPPYYALLELGRECGVPMDSSSAVTNLQVNEPLAHLLSSECTQTTASVETGTAKRGLSRGSNTAPTADTSPTRDSATLSPAAAGGSAAQEPPLAPDAVHVDIGEAAGEAFLAPDPAEAWTLRRISEAAERHSAAAAASVSAGSSGGGGAVCEAVEGEAGGAGGSAAEEWSALGPGSANSSTTRERSWIGQSRGVSVAARQNVFSLTSVTDSLAEVSKGPKEGLKTRDIVAQIILILPLCELGNLSECTQGISKIPFGALPPRLQQSMPQLRVPDSLQQPGVRPQGICEDTEDDGAASVQPWAHMVSIKDLPFVWALILKVQLAIQVLDGLEALHRASLVHCDVKLDNIFLTADAAFEPFGICAKVGDLDTCRSLKRSRNDSTMSHLSNSYPEQVEDVLEVSAASNSLLGTSMAHSHFTSCVKGTPGYLAPEMITQGRVRFETDVFSLAVTISILLSRSAKFKKYDSLRMVLLPDYSVEVLPELQRTLHECRADQPSMRPSLDTLRAALNKQMAALFELADATLADAEAIA